MGIKQTFCAFLKLTLANIKEAQTLKRYKAKIDTSRNLSQQPPFTIKSNFPNFLSILNLSGGYKNAAYVIIRFVNAVYRVTLTAGGSKYSTVFDVRQSTDAAAVVRNHFCTDQFIPFLYDVVCGHR